MYIDIIIINHQATRFYVNKHCFICFARELNYMKRNKARVQLRSGESPSKMLQIIARISFYYFFYF